MDINQAYDIKFNNISNTEDDLILCCQDGRSNIRGIDCPEWEITAAASIAEYVSKRGMKDILNLRKTKYGKYYFKEEDKTYILLDRLPDGKIHKRSRDRAIISAGLLARFHNAAEGYRQPPGVKADVLWGRKMDKFKRMTCVLEKYCDRVKEKVEPDKFEIASYKYLDNFLKRAWMSTKIIRSLKYIERLEESMKKKEVCLNSFGKLKYCGEKVYIDDIFHIGYNMIEEDVALLVKDAIESLGDKRVFVDIIEEYKKYRDLDEFSIKVIKAIVSYPYDSIKIIERYIKNPSLTMDEHIDKFLKYAQREEKTELLEV